MYTIYTQDRCGYCSMAKHIMVKNDIDFMEINISYDPQARSLIKSMGFKTVPQIFIGEHHIGGNFELQILEREGKLDDLLKD